MSSLFWVTYGLLWLVMAVVVALVMLIYRQFGLMIMPGSKRVNYGGLNVGSRAPALRLKLDGGADVDFRWSPLSASDQMKATLALFALPACPLCARLAEDYEGLAALAERFSSVQFMWIQWEDAPEHDIALPATWTVARSVGTDAHDAMEIPGSPFAYLITTNGRIATKGLVNEASEIDHLIASAPAVVEAAEPVAPVTS